MEVVGEVVQQGVEVELEVEGEEAAVEAEGVVVETFSPIMELLGDEYSWDPGLNFKFVIKYLDVCLLIWIV